MTILDNLSDGAQEFISKLREKLELDSDEAAVLRVMEIFDSACEEAGIPVEEALKNASEIWTEHCRADMVAQGFIYYRFGVMTNEWGLWAKDQKVAHMAMIMYLNHLSVGMVPIAVYEPEDDKGPPFGENALISYFGGDFEKFIVGNKPAINAAIDTIMRTAG